MLLFEGALLLFSWGVVSALNILCRVAVEVPKTRMQYSEITVPEMEKLVKGPALE